jgi:hypothetical protein
VPAETVQIQSDQLRDQIQAEGKRNATYSIGASGLVITVGYVVLASRFSLWLLSLLTARPMLWRGFDPVEVLFAWEDEKKKGPGMKGVPEDEETLQSIVK